MLGEVLGHEAAGESGGAEEDDVEAARTIVRAGQRHGAGAWRRMCAAPLDRGSVGKASRVFPDLSSERIVPRRRASPRATLRVVLKVLLADDHTIVREGLRALLASDAGIEIVGEASNGLEAVQLAERTKPDVVVMDLAMPELNGVDATARIRAASPSTQVVVLSMHATAAHVRPALKAGARGYLLKGSGLSDLLRAIRSVAGGEAFFSPAVASLLLESGDESGGTLTPREREVLQLVGEGHSSASIAERLHLSVKTVEGHRSRLMVKLRATNVAGLVRHAVRLGLVDPSAATE